MFFYVNVAPRKDDTDSRENNDGEDLVYIELENGVPIVTTFSGYTLSFIRDKIAKMRALDIPSQGSQFRSRDIFPEALARVMKGDKSVFDGEVETEIPELSEKAVGHIDGFGNIKTTIRESEVELEKGEKIEVEVNDMKQQMTRSDGIFHVPEGELVYAPGSSGGEDSFMEIVLRGGSAARKLGEPEPGDMIKFPD
ncbi:MAG: SAM hydroxide adenosyltransferase [Candidatus Nanohalobium sp.]